jgi:hypothetical protein
MHEFQLPPIVERHYEFCRWIIPKVSKFPRDQRHIFGSRIESLSLNVLEQLIAAAMQSGTEKQAVLQTVNIQLEQLRYLLRMAKDTRQMSEKSYHHAARLIAETGKQLGGWIRSTKA